MKLEKMCKLFFSLMLMLLLVACNNVEKKEIVFDKQGTFDVEETLNSVKITADNVILSNKIIEGDLIIDVQGLEGDLTLENINVKGMIVVNQPKAEYAIRMYDVKTDRMVVNNDLVPLRLYASRGTEISSLSSSGGISLTEQSLTKNGFGDVTVRNAKNGVITLLSTGLNTLTVSDSDNVTIFLDEASLISNVTVNSQTNLIGKGTIDLLTANANVVYDIIPSSVVAKDGVLVSDRNQSVTTVVTTTKSTTTTSKSSITTTKSTTTLKVTTPSTTTSKPVTTTPQVTTVYNTPPIIAAADVTLTVGSSFDPLSGVTIYDKEDGGYITVKQSHILSNSVNTNIKGNYNVIYSYTDKNGSTTTYTRKVIVEQGNKLAIPTGLKVSSDNRGGIKFEWNTVTNAYSYDIYVNGKFVENVRRTNVFVEDYVSLTRENTLGVVAVPATNSTLKDSDVATMKYQISVGYIKVPTNIETSSTVTHPIKFEFGDDLLVSRVDYDVEVYLEKLENKRYYPAADVRLNKGVITNSNGFAVYSGYNVGGEQFDAIFTEPGNYRITLDLIVDNKVYESLEAEFFVDGDEPLDIEDYEPYITDLFGKYWFGSRTDDEGFGVTFELDYDLEFTSGVEVFVIFEYQINNNTPVIITTVNDTSMGMKKKVIANTPYEAFIYPGKAGVTNFDLVMRGLEPSDIVKIQAHVNVRIGGLTAADSTGWIRIYQ